MDEGDRDIASCSTNTSRWSSPCCDSDGPEHPSDCEERADRTPGTKGAQKQKMKHEIQKLPPISPLQGSKPRNQSANMNCIWMLKSRFGICSSS
ncbi:hypothetical protein AMECASPLE_009192 [Ameca splendens]|uniref:Uncharacterized protein n=1 Tax=Ameca splendens TaxID=208324 RepID=A0ABV0XPD2_9TELE